MPNNPDRPFDDDTVAIRAVFVPEGAEDKVSHAEIFTNLGYDVAKVSAIFVPDGAPRPGYPYEDFGRAEFRPDDDAQKGRADASGDPSSQPDEDATGAGERGPALPRTRYRFGRALSGRSPGLPPNPTPPGAHDNPVKAAIAVLRGVDKATRAFAAQRARRTGHPAAAADPRRVPETTDRED